VHSNHIRHFGAQIYRRKYQKIISTPGHDLWWKKFHHPNSQLRILSRTSTSYYILEGEHCEQTEGGESISVDSWQCFIKIVKYNLRRNVNVGLNVSPFRCEAAQSCGPSKFAYIFLSRNVFCSINLRLWLRTHSKEVEVKRCRYAFPFCV
jgi:hypothetical protein